jgi:hypothetical protein
MFVMGFFGGLWIGSIVGFVAVALIYWGGANDPS